MTGRRGSAALVLLDLATAAALLWMTLSDSWLAIGTSAVLVASRLVPARAAAPGGYGHAHDHVVR